MANKHQVLALHAAGVGPTEIARRLDCCLGYVSATLQRLRSAKRREMERVSQRRRYTARKARKTQENIHG